MNKLVVNKMIHNIRMVCKAVYITIDEQCVSSNRDLVVKFNCRLYLDTAEPRLNTNSSTCCIVDAPNIKQLDKLIGDKIPEYKTIYKHK